jgi:hypothetical protein
MGTEEENNGWGKDTAWGEASGGSHSLESEAFSRTVYGHRITFNKITFRHLVVQVDLSEC